MAKHNFTPEQITEFQKTFLLFDKDNKGFITELELYNAMKAMGDTPDKQEVKQMVQEIDEDGNGEVDFDEFLLLMNKVVNNNQDDYDIVMKAFECFDYKAIGEIEMGQLKKTLTLFGEKLTEDEVDEMIKECEYEGYLRVNYKKLIEDLAKGIEFPETDIESEDL